jgi:hypothetical protein
MLLFTGRDKNKKDEIKMTKQEILIWLETVIAELQKEYDEQKERTKNHRTGNPYIVGLGTKLMTMKDFKEKIDSMIV